MSRSHDDALPRISISISRAAQPAGRPSESPAASPSAAPSILPSDAPSESPSAAPTHRPTSGPSETPTSSSRPTPLIWPSASPSASASPTGGPTAIPSESPSPGPTATPSGSPSPGPTASPTPAPTTPAPATPAPTARPTRKPSTAGPSAMPVAAVSNPPTVGTPPPSTDRPAPGPGASVTLAVPSSVMELGGVPGELAGGAMRAWARETRWRIEAGALAVVKGGGENLVVTVRAVDQEALPEGGRRRMSPAGRDRPSTGVTPRRVWPWPERGYLRRLQSSSSSSPRLRIEFATTIDFDSDEDWGQEDANEMVAAGFRTLAQQEEYVASLKDANDRAFGNVDGMAMEVDGVLITETEDSKPLEPVKTNPNTKWYIVGGAVGGTLLLLAAVVIGTHHARNRSKGEERQQPHPSKSKTSPAKSVVTQDRPSVRLDGGSEGGGTPPPPQALFPQQRPSSPPAPAPPIPAPDYFGTIESRENADDDVSTLGDPYFGEGAADPGAAETRADDTVAESMISSEQEMYVFGVGRQRLMTGGSSSKMSICGGGGTHGGPSMFGDDTTLEDAYRTPGEGGALRLDGPSSRLRRLRVVAPPGKLGIVIDNEMGDMPIVHAIKETSVLNGRVNVGDLLISVDEVDCRGMSATQVSRLISSRSQSPARALVLLRGSVGGC